MRTPEIHAARKLIVRAGIFLALFVPIYLGSVAVLSGISSGGTSLMQRFTGNPVQPGGAGHSLIRFREIDDVGQVDVLFVGSSHAYHSFDPRVFRDRGLEVFNMGSTNQTPLNTYFLLDRYLPKLSPRVVVMELFYLVLAGEGLESFFDLSVNLPFNGAIVRMALALDNVSAVNSLVSTLLTRLGRPLPDVTQRPVDGQTYWAGGYSEMHTAPSDTPQGLRRELEIREEQMDYLLRSIRLAQDAGAAVMLVVQPLTSQYLGAISNVDELRREIESVAADTGVLFIDYSAAIELDPFEHYSDEHHLNGIGAEIFSHAVADALEDQILSGNAESND